MNPADIPDWVPQTVKSMATVFEMGGSVRDRLLSDVRMKKVWGVIQKSEVNEAYLNSLDGLRRLSGFEVSEHGLTSQERAAASFYSYAVNELSMFRPVLTQTNINEATTRWLAAANVCDEIWAYDYKPLNDAALAKSLATASEHLRRCARSFSLQKQTSPLVIDKSSGMRGDDEIRIRVRLLADETCRLFNSPLYNTVGTVASVALAVPPLSEKTIINWCKNLPSPGEAGSPK